MFADRVVKHGVCPRLYFYQGKWFVICDIGACRRIYDSSAEGAHAHCRLYHTPCEAASKCVVCGESFDASRLVAHMRSHSTELECDEHAAREDVVRAYKTYLQRLAIDTTLFDQRVGASSSTLHRVQQLRAHVHQTKPIGVNFLPAPTAQRPLPFVEIESGFKW